MTKPISLSRLRHAREDSSIYGSDQWMYDIDAILEATDTLLEDEIVWWCDEHGYSGWEKSCLYPYWYALANASPLTSDIDESIQEAAASCRMTRVAITRITDERKET